MNIEDLKLTIMKYVKLEEIHIKGNQKHIHIIAISDIFIGMNNVEKQQKIYTPLTQYIVEKKIHAITIDTFTCKEWKLKKNQFNL